MMHNTRSRSSAVSTLPLRRSTVLLLAFSVVFSQSACSLLPKARSSIKQAASGKPAAGHVPDEVSLKADRTQFDELRKEVPEDVRRENDELALIAELMAKGDEEPGKVRDRFNKVLRSRRETNDRTLRRQREDFTVTERKQRDDFLKKQKDQRDAFVAKRGVTPDQRKRFFEDQELVKKQFFADAADKRKDFEESQSDARKTFEDYVRERTNEFNQEHREYTTAYYDRQRALALKKRMDDKAKAQGWSASPPAQQNNPQAPAASSGNDPWGAFNTSAPQVQSIPVGAPGDGK